MRKLDEQELKIVKALTRNPRLSDNRLGELYDIPVRTVSRKRARLEREGLLRYFAEVDMSADGTGYFPCSHLYIIRCVHLSPPSSGSSTPAKPAPPTRSEAPRS